MRCAPFHHRRFVGAEARLLGFGGVEFGDGAERQQQNPDRVARNPNAIQKLKIEGTRSRLDPRRVNIQISRAQAEVGDIDGLDQATQDRIRQNRDALLRAEPQLAQGEMVANRAINKLMSDTVAQIYRENPRLAALTRAPHPLVTAKQRIADQVNAKFLRQSPVKVNAGLQTANAFEGGLNLGYDFNRGTSRLSLRAETPTEQAEPLPPPSPAKQPSAQTKPPSADVDADAQRKLESELNRKVEKQAFEARPTKPSLLFQLAQKIVDAAKKPKQISKKQLEEALGELQKNFNNVLGPAERQKFLDTVNKTLGNRAREIFVSPITGLLELKFPGSSSQEKSTGAPPKKEDAAK